MLKIKLKTIKAVVFIQLLFSVLFNPYLFSQSQIHIGKTKTIELIHANSLEYDPNIVAKAKRLLGNVSFKDGNAIMYCDSAYLYDNNSADAFGNIRFTQGDTINVTGKTLHYDGTSKIAELHDNIQMSDREIILTTNVLYYNVKDGVANYTGGGKIINKENILTSENGYYYTKAKEMHFKKNVLLINPQYTMRCDTLEYNTLSKTAFFTGPTRINSKEDYIYCENGWYNTATNIAQFNKNAFIVTDEHRLKADSLYYDKKAGIGKGFKNVEVVDTVQKIIISGDYAYNNELTFVSIVTGHALMSQIHEMDTLFIHADTLKSLVNIPKSKDSRLMTNDSSLNQLRTIYAYHKVKIFRKDIQGKCDSMTYNYADSTMRLYKEPILWSQQNQLTAERIELTLSKGMLSRLNLINSAFIISENDSVKYNQIKGKNMYGTFVDNKLYKIKVVGNGQTIYYAKENDKYLGVNRAECTDLLVFLKNNQVDRVTFITKPDATLFPMSEADPKELKLKDFIWKIQERPVSKKDIF